VAASRRPCSSTPFRAWGGADLKTSFIIPAHNEEYWVGDCITAIRHATGGLGAECEILVVDDASTDGTAVVAEQHGARVVRISANHISASRNAGGRAARGEALFFVDADTLVNRSAVRQALEALKRGAVGGGSIPRYDGDLPLWVRLGYPLFLLVTSVLKQPGGSCLFCTRAAFDTFGGFNEAIYVAEDAHFASQLKRVGRFVVIREKVLTSGRNFRVHPLQRYMKLGLHVALRGPGAFRDREGFEIWYRPNRGDRNQEGQKPQG
jgi:glycosyltransferase involved in cell wall biosynthesis